MGSGVRLDSVEAFLYRQDDVWYESGLCEGVR